MHIDGKIGYRQVNNHKQRTMNRLLFSVVRDAVSDQALEKESAIDNSKLVSDVYENDSLIRRSVEKVQADQKQYGATACFGKSVYFKILIVFEKNSVRAKG